MTCVIGWRDNNGKVCIGADSAGVNGNLIITRKDKKVFQNNHMLIAYTTSFRMGQLLQTSLKLPEPDPHKNDFQYMCTDVINSIRECFKNGGFLTIKDQKEQGGHFLIGYNGELYHIEGDFQVGISEKDYHADGSGRDIAFGCCFALEKVNMPIETKIKTALAASSNFCTGVCAPFHIMSINKKGEIEVYE